MQRTYVRDLGPKSDGKSVLLKGFVHEVRDLSKIKFVLLRDMTGIVQLVAPKEKVSEAVFKEIPKILPESVLEIEGIVKENKEAKKGFEVLIKELRILSSAEKLPLQVFEKDKSIQTDLSTRLNFRSLDLRKPEALAVFRIQSVLIRGMQEFLNSQGFMQVFTPSIMGAASESGADVFKVDYYGRDAFLRQDPQLHRQLTIAGGIERLYDLGPSWRAEHSHTTKHLCEHRACAPEFAFIKDEMDIIALEQDLVVAAIKKIRELCAEELELLNVKLSVPKTPFPEFRFPKIYGMLEKLGKKIPHGQDLDAEANKAFGDFVKKKYKCDFYFFNRFPSAIKPFYVMKVDEQPEYARSVDLNAKGIELSSGGQREHRYAQLMERIKELRLNSKNFEWFTKFFKWGVPPHGGFAIGIERLTQAVLDLPNIKEAVLFPRDPERLEP